VIACDMYIYIVIIEQDGQERKVYFASFEVFVAV